MARVFLQRVSDALDWLYEFRIPIVLVILLVLMFAFHSCEFRISIDSRPSETTTEQGARK